LLKSIPEYNDNDNVGNELSENGIMEFLYVNGSGVPEYSLGTLLSRQASQSNEGGANFTPTDENEYSSYSEIQPQGGSLPEVGVLCDCWA
jgi:hypothetical protein